MTSPSAPAANPDRALEIEQAPSVAGDRLI
jgi:hypothetical protein